MKLLGEVSSVCTYYGCCADLDNVYISMELVLGGGVRC